VDAFVNVVGSFQLPTACPQYFGSQRGVYVCKPAPANSYPIVNKKIALEVYNDIKAILEDIRTKVLRIF
jgi:hypothetical protein